jgi:hypothetical protein
MAQGSSLLLPQLAGVPLIHRVVADDRLAVMLAKSLVELDIAVPGDWKRAECDPTSFIRITLERCIKAHGGPAIRRRFLLVAAISDTPCEWAERDETKPNQLFLIVEPSEASCGCVTFGPTLQLLEKVHPQLPATFFHLFVGALNAWIRIYDHRDAEDRAETLREWAAQEADADQYEIPDVQGSIPPCMRQAALEDGDLTRLKSKINDPLATKLIEAAINLDRVSAQAKRPEIDDDIGQQLSDCNPPLPCLLALFAEGDGVEACFTEEADGMLEVNDSDSGQFILGEPLNERNWRSRLRLRPAWELFPEIVDPSLDDDGQPSCSAAAALERQEPFINATLAQHALALLARLFRYGEISYHGSFINLATGVTSVVRIDPQYWKRARRASKRNWESSQSQ